MFVKHPKDCHKISINDLVIFSRICHAMDHPAHNGCLCEAAKNVSTRWQTKRTMSSTRNEHLPRESPNKQVWQDNYCCHFSANGNDVIWKSFKCHNWNHPHNLMPTGFFINALQAPQDHEIRTNMLFLLLLKKLFLCLPWFQILEL